MVLGSVTLAPESSDDIHKFPPEGAEMTYIVICSEIVRCKIRLEMQGDHIVDAAALKGCLIRIDIPGILFFKQAHKLIQRHGVQDVIMIHESIEIPVSQFKTGIGIL